MMSKLAEAWGHLVSRTSLALCLPIPGQALAPLLLAALFLSMAGAADDAEIRRNVLMIVIDDAAPQLHSVGQDGPMRTPNLERLAERGTWFRQAYCAAPACNPSRAAMLTGVEPSRSGIYYNSQKSPETWIAGAETLVARFRGAGYLAAGYGKIAHAMVASVPDYSPGFARPHNSSAHVRHRDSDLFAHLLPGTLRDGGTESFSLGKLPDDWDRDDPEKWQQDTEQAERAIALLSQPHDGPFFLGVGFWRPHVRFAVPARYFDRHPLEEVEVPTGYHPFDLEDLPPRGRLMSWSDRHHVEIVKRGMWRELIQGYCAAMSYVDEQIGRVLDALEASEHAENTIVVFLSDNGMHLGEKNHWLKYTLWEQATRVFLSISVPGFPRQALDTPVSLVDLYPTLAALTGIGRPAHDLDGIDLTPLLVGESDERGRPVLSTWGRGNHAIRDGRYRYIRYRNGDEELYDHRADEHEWRNLATDPALAPVKARLSGYLPEADAPNVRKTNPPKSELDWDDLDW